MRIKFIDYMFFSFVSIILATIFIACLSGCSPFAVVESEKIVEELIQDVAEEELKGK